MKHLLFGTLVLCSFSSTAQTPCDSLVNACFVPSQTGQASFFFNNCSATPDPNGTQYLWEFGDGTSSNAIAPTHQFPAGVWTVCLFTFWQNCVDSTCTVITVQGGGSGCDSTFAANFTWTDQGGQIAVFMGSSTLPANGYVWSLGDGNTTYGMNTQHYYQQPGQYYVCLDAWYWDQGTQDTCWTSTCQWIVIGGVSGCDSTFFVACNAFTQSNIGFFQATSGGQADGYLWEFGDGTTGYGQSTQHIYTQPGQYYACVNAWYWDAGTQDTCWTSCCQWLTVAGQSSPCDSLTAGFIASGSGPGVNFANDVIDLTWSYLWDFGDGSTGSGPNPYHVFPQSGQYLVCLTVWTWDPFTQDTCWADTCQWITVSGGGNPCDSLVNACFVPSQTGQASFFFNNCSATPDPNGTQYLWEFGDGTSSNAIAPTHQFPAGVWTVCLFTFWQNCVDSTCTVITVQGGGSGCDSTFAANFTWTDQGGQIAVFMGSSTLPANGYVWSLGDGNTTYGMNTQHYYQQPGQYYVCLDAWYWDQGTQDTCWTSTCQWIVVGGGGSPCDSLILADFSWTSQGQVVFFENLSIENGTQVNYHWDMGDGTTTTATDPIHAYPDTVAYQVCLTMNAWTGLDSCSATICQWVSPGNNGTNAVHERDPALAWGVGPIPTLDLVQLHLPNTSGRVEWSIHDLGGRLVKWNEVRAQDHMTMDLTGLAPGSYLLRVLANGNSRTFQLLKE